LHQTRSPEGRNTSTMAILAATASIAHRITFSSHVPGIPPPSGVAERLVDPPEHAARASQIFCRSLGCIKFELLPHAMYVGTTNYHGEAIPIWDCGKPVNTPTFTTVTTNYLPKPKSP
jgi:hypothetical protein